MLAGAGNADSIEPGISADGQHVAFWSFASNLVPGDTNGRRDVFVNDLETGAIAAASANIGGTLGNGDSTNPSVSADGRYVAFQSFASDLVTGDTNGRQDVFRKDMQTGAIMLVSSATGGGTLGNSDSFEANISPDGRYVAFCSWASNLVSGDTNSDPDVFVKDTQTGTTTRVSTDGSNNQVWGNSYDPSISADGNLVAFHSTASALVSGDTNNTRDVFVKNLSTGSVTRVSTSTANGQGE